LDTAKDEEQKILIRKSIGAGENLLNIVNDLLDLSKIESGRLLLQEKSFHLNSFLEEIIDTFRMVNFKNRFVVYSRMG